MGAHEVGAARDRAAPALTARVRLPLIVHPLRLAGFLVALVVVGGGAFLAGSTVRSPQDSALDAIDQALDVTVIVAERVVAQGVTLPAKLIPAAVESIPAPSAEFGVDAGVGRLVVTLQALEPGDVLVPGTLLGQVSGSSLIAVPPGLPLYRDLVDGSTGPDVIALQSMLEGFGLEVSVTGEVGPRTLAAVEELYRRLGVRPSDPSTIRWTDFQSVPVGAEVVAAAPVGTPLTVDVGLLSIRTAPPVITAAATVLEADELVVGGPVLLRTPRHTAESVVLAIGEFAEFADGTGSGRIVTVQVPDELEIDGSEPISISTGADPEPGPAVPLVALRQDANGTYVERVTPGASDDRTPVTERVGVTVIAQADGWAAIAEGDLPIGVEILVSR